MSECSGRRFLFRFATGFAMTVLPCLPLVCLGDATGEFVVIAGKMSVGTGNPGIVARVLPPSNEAWATNVFNQAAVKEGSDAAQLGPDPSVPYFVVRFALPIPPDNDTNLSGAKAG